MRTSFKYSVLLSVPLVTLGLLNCGEPSTGPEDDPSLEAASDATLEASEEGEAEVAAFLSASTTMTVVTADEILTDPFFDLLLSSLVAVKSASRLRDARDDLLTALADGDPESIQARFIELRKKVQDYPRQNDPDDSVHMDLVDLFIDAIEELLPPSDGGKPNKDKGKGGKK